MRSQDDNPRTTWKWDNDKWLFPHHRLNLSGH